jgi:hypothetical protein
MFGLVMVFVPALYQLLRLSQALEKSIDRTLHTKDALVLAEVEWFAVVLRKKRGRN